MAYVAAATDLGWHAVLQLQCGVRVPAVDEPFEQADVQVEAPSAFGAQAVLLYLRPQLLVVACSRQKASM